MQVLFRRVRTVIGSAIAALGLITASTAQLSAQAYPTGPVQIVVAYGPGGGTDTLARLLAPSLSKILNTPVTVQNLPGGGGQVAAATMLRDGGDGHVILATNEPDMFMSTVFSHPHYKAEDLQILMVDVQDPRVFLVKTDSPIKDFGSFVARAKAEPNKLTVSVAQGSAQELFAKWLFGRLGIQVRIVGYDGGGPAANAVIAGDVTATIGDDFARMNVRPQSRALFVGSKGKSPRWPEAPTLTDALEPLNVTPPSPDFLSRYGVYVVSAAFKTKNPAAYAKLQQAMIQAREAPEFRAYFDKNSLHDLSIGRTGESMQATMSLDFQEIPKIK